MDGRDNCDVVVGDGVGGVWDGGGGDGVVIVAAGDDMVVMVPHGNSVSRISLICDWEFS